VKILYALSTSLILSAAPAAAQDTAQPAPAEQAAPAAQAAPAEQPAAPMTVAAPQAAVAAAPAPQCELHVWPAERFQAMTTGWLGGGLLDAAIHAEGDKARRSHLASALDSEGQLISLQKLDLVSLLRLPPSKIVTHAEALDRKTVNKIKTRRSDSTASCYSELIVTDVFYQKAAMWGRSLRTGFMLRQFPAGAAEPTIRKTTGGNGLKIFPAKEGEDTTAADAELVSIFQKNFTEAAENFAKQAR
jgi:hypothetical protein